MIVHQDDTGCSVAQGRHEDLPGVDHCAVNGSSGNDLFFQQTPLAAEA